MTRLLVLYGIAFVDMVGLAMVLPLLPYYATSLGVSAGTVGILVSAFSLAQLASAPAWGRLSDRTGRRPAIVLGLAVTAVAYALFAMADTVFLLLCSRVIQGLGGGTLGVVQAYVVDESPGERRTRNLGWLSAATSLGAVAGPAFGSVLLSLGGRAAPGAAAAALATLVAGFAWFCLRESRSIAHTAEHQAPAAVPTGARAFFSVVTNWRAPAPRLILTYTLGIGAFYGTVPIMPLLLEARLGITEHTVGYVIMYLGLMGVLVRSVALGRLIDRLGEVRLARAGVTLLAAGLACLGLATNYPVLTLSLTLMPLGTAFLFPSLTGRLSRVIPRGDRGFYLGIQQAWGGASRVVFPIVTGFAMDHIGVGVPFVAAGALVLATLRLTTPAPPARVAAEGPPRHTTAEMAVS